LSALKQSNGETMMKATKENAAELNDGWWSQKVKDDW
jgi:hypothetical protein